jgi:hypothetical protein
LSIKKSWNSGLLPGLCLFFALQRQGRFWAQKNMLAAAGGTGYTENNQSTQLVEKKELAAPCMHTLSAWG